MKIKILLSLLLILLGGEAFTQVTPIEPVVSTRQADFWADPTYASEGKSPARHEFISYTIRKLAEAGDPNASNHYLPLEGKWRVNYSTTADRGEVDFYQPRYSVAAWSEVQVPNVALLSSNYALDGLAPSAIPAETPLVQYRAEIGVPYLWLDREVYIHVEGVGSAYTLYINGKRMGYSNDSRTPAEYNISSALTDGRNSVSIEVYGFSVGDWMEGTIQPYEAGTLGRVYIYSQPKLSIRDFVITTKLDTLTPDAIVGITTVLSNSYRSTETVSVGYDIYSPDGGKLLTYNLFETEITGESCDTLYFEESIYPSNMKLWSAESPTRYKMMLYVRRDGRITEYIPLRFGIQDTQWREGELYVNRKPIKISAVRYSASRKEDITLRELKQLKAKGVNTLALECPQPFWFYELCDRIGFYVIDQANNNPSYGMGDMNVGGSLVNNPAYLPQFLDRVAQMQGRTKNVTSLIATSLGGEVGNGYNFYKSYQALKAVDSLHVVTFPSVDGQWNSDVPFPEAPTAAEVLGGSSSGRR